MQQRKLHGGSCYSSQRKQSRLSFRRKFTRMPPRIRGEKAAQVGATVARNNPRGNGKT
jgi:hypothetical protein